MTVPLLALVVLATVLALLVGSSKKKIPPMWFALPGSTMNMTINEIVFTHPSYGSYVT